MSRYGGFPRLLARLACFCWLAAAALFAGEIYEPPAVYLTWQRSPQTTMTVQWITKPDRPDDLIVYQQKGCSEWSKAKGSHVHMPEGYPYLIHTAELTGLSPCTDYLFRTGFDAVEYAFRTLPAHLESPLKLAVGGDVYHENLEAVEKMNKVVAAQDPAFAVIGGDIAYSVTGRFGFAKDNMQRWLDWLAAWKKTMVAPDGRLIPLLPAIGNHEVKGGFGKTPEAAPFFYALFAMPGPQGYNVLDCGDYLALFLLDSGHTHPIDGEQAHWLYHALEARQGMPHKLAVYHVPAYPSVRAYNSDTSPQVREFWVPIFENFGLHAAFEHHDHAYKRSYPILNGRPDPKGVLYIGDGGWGVVHPRIPKKPGQLWYLAKTVQESNVILVTLLPGSKRTYKALDPLGHTIDEYQQPQPSP